MNQSQALKGKSISLVFTVIKLGLFIGMIQMFFDENYRNDRFGWSFLLGILFVQGIQQLIKQGKSGRKKNRLINMLFIASIFGFLLWQGLTLI